MTLLKHHILQIHASGSEGATLSPTVIIWKKILQNKQSQMILCLILFPAFDWRKLKEEIAERRNFPEISIYQANLYKQ